MDVRAIQGRLVNAGYPIAIDGDFGPASYAASFAFVGRQRMSQLCKDLGAAADQHFAPAAIVTELRIAHALAQWAVETRGFTAMEEDLDYSVSRLRAVWPKRFPSDAAALPYAGHPQALANRNYGQRFGNIAPNDGWLYRGRGLTMETFKDNYADAAHLTGLDLVGNPDLVATAAIGLQVACTYWSHHGCNAFADADDVADVRHAVNGGAIGLDLATRYLARAKLIFHA